MGDAHPATKDVDAPAVMVDLQADYWPSSHLGVGLGAGFCDVVWFFSNDGMLSWVAPTVSFVDRERRYSLGAALGVGLGFEREPGGSAHDNGLYFGGVASLLFPVGVFAVGPRLRLDGVKTGLGTTTLVTVGPLVELSFD